MKTIETHSFAQETFDDLNQNEQVRTLELCTTGTNRRICILRLGRVSDLRSRQQMTEPGHFWIDATALADKLDNTLERIFQVEPVEEVHRIVIIHPNETGIHSDYELGEELILSTDTLKELVRDKEDDSLFWRAIVRQKKLDYDVLKGALVG